MLQTSSKIILNVCVILALAGSAALKPKPPIPEYVPTFSYTPSPDPSDTTAAFGTVVVVEPTWGKDMPLGATQHATFIQFRNALAQASTAVMNAKNISVKGPASSLEDMTFSEKKESHLVLTTDLQLNVVCQANGRRSFSSSSTNQQYMDYTYTTDLQGAIVLKVLEPQSRELLWQKRIDILPAPFTQNVSMTTQGNFCNQNFPSWNVEHRNAVFQSLETQYTTVLKKLDSMLSKSEVASLSKQAIEIKSKKVY